MQDLNAIFAQVGGDISMASLARAAGFHSNYLYLLRTGRRIARPATLAKLRFALIRIRMQQTQGSHKDVVFYRAILALTAQALNLDPALVQDAKPRAKRVFDKDWYDASTARRLALYLMNCGLGISQAEVARSCGMTKQAISLAMREIEDRRDEDHEFDGLVSKLEEMLVGRDAAQ